MMIHNKSMMNDDEPEIPGADIAKSFSDFARFEKKFLEERKIFLWGVVTDKSAEQVVNRMLYLESIDPGKPIYFYINSPGGVVTSGMVMMDAMKLITSPVHTISMGLAASMGSLLLSHGEKGNRSIWPNGRVMIHQPSIGGAQGTAADLEITAREIIRTKQLGARILADNCGQTFEKVMKDFDRDYWMNAEEAVKYGIVDKIADKL